MSTHRQDRMANEIKRSLAQIIQEEMKDPRIDFSTISITRIDVTNDFSHARINISVLGDDDKQKKTMQALQKAKGYIRTELSKTIQVRHFPELEFRLDKSIEHGMRISALLEEIKQEEPAKEKK